MSPWRLLTDSPVSLQVLFCIAKSYLKRWFSLKSTGRKLEQFYARLLTIVTKLLAARQQEGVPTALQTFVSTNGVAATLPWSVITPEVYECTLSQGFNLLRLACDWSFSEMTARLQAKSPDEISVNDVVQDSVSERVMAALRLFFLATGFMNLDGSGLNSNDSITRVTKMKALLRYLQEPISNDSRKAFAGLSSNGYASLLHEVLGDIVVKAPTIIGLLGQNEMMDIIREVVAFANLGTVDIIPLPGSYQGWAMQGWSIIKEKLSVVAKNKLLVPMGAIPATPAAPTPRKSGEELLAEHQKAVGQAVGAVIWEFLRTPQLALATLSASCRTLTSVRTMAVVVEGCIEGHLLQSRDWNAIGTLLATAFFL